MFDSGVVFDLYSDDSFDKFVVLFILGFWS